MSLLASDLPAGMRDLYFASGMPDELTPHGQDMVRQMRAAEQVSQQSSADQSAAIAAARMQGYGVINPAFLSNYDRMNAQYQGGAAIMGAPGGTYHGLAPGAMGPIPGGGLPPRGLNITNGGSGVVGNIAGAALTQGPTANEMQAYRNKMNPITPDMTPSQVAQAQIARDPTGAAKEFLMSTGKNPISPSQELNQRLATGASAFSNIQPWLSKKGYGGTSEIGLNDLLDEELVSHPIFAKLRQTDPDKAEAVYQSFNGRSLQGDLAAHHDIVQTQQKGFNDFTKDQLAKGASPNPFTGKWMVANDVEIPDIMAPGGKRMTRQMMPATVEQEHMLNKGYYPVTGRDLPNVAPTAKEYLAKGEVAQAGLSPEQTAKYKEHVTAFEKLKGGKLNPAEEGRARLLAMQDVSKGGGGFMGTMANVEDFYKDVWNRTGGQYHPATSISPQALASSPLRGFAAPMAAPAGGLEGLARGMSVYPEMFPAPTAPAQLLGRGGLPVSSPAMQAAIAAGPDQMIAPPAPPFGNRPALSRIIKPYERLGPYALQSLQRVSAQPQGPFVYNPSLSNPAATAADLAYR